MRKTLIVSLVIALCTVGCKKTNKEGIMDHNTMANFLYEVHIIDSYYQIQNNYHYEEQVPEIKATYEKLFAKYGITKDEYERSMNYYAHHNNEFYEIYNQVNDSLTALLQRTQNSNPMGTFDDDQESKSIF